MGSACAHGARPSARVSDERVRSTARGVAAAAVCHAAPRRVRAAGPAADTIAIVAMAGLTDAIYHLNVYGDLAGNDYVLQIGAVAASIFVLPNILRGEYVLANYLAVRPTCGARCVSGT